MKNNSGKGRWPWLCCMGVLTFLQGHAPSEDCWAGPGLLSPWPGTHPPWGPGDSSRPGPAACRGSPSGNSIVGTGRSLQGEHSAQAQGCAPQDRATMPLSSKSNRPYQTAGWWVSNNPVPPSTPDTHAYTHTHSPSHWSEPALSLSKYRVQRTHVSLN
jgi:hypothetical protein